ncbi:MAG: TetR/AcrR family transcriptional regulator [Sphingomonadaceae bacterium]
MRDLTKELCVEHSAPKFLEVDMPKVIDHDAVRDALADAFMRVISAKGTAAVTMREIAREAGVSQTLPLYYFDNRQAMMDFAFERHADLAVDGLVSKALGEATARERLTATITWLIERSTSSKSTWRTVIGMIIQHNDQSRIEELDQRCYNRFLELLSRLMAEYRDEAQSSIEPDGEAVLILTCTDGLALATASLGASAKEHIAPLKRILFARYGLND